MAQLMLVNPRKRRTTTRRRKPSTSVVSRRRTSTVTTRRRRNPIRAKGVMETVQKSAVGAAGAIAVDVAMSKLPIPAALTANPMLAAATKGAVGIGLGMLVSKFGKKKRLGEQLAEGAVTISLYGVGKSMIGPSLGLSGMDEGLLGMDEGLLGFDDFDDDLGYVGVEPVSAWEDDEYAEMGEYSDF